MLGFVKRHKKLLIVIVIAVLAFLGYRWWSSRQQTAKQETAVASLMTLEETLTLSGEVDAEEKTTLQFGTGGILAYVGIKEGDEVRKHQTLARLDTKQVRSQLEKTLNSYMKVRWDFEQLNDDHPDRAIINDEIKRILEKSQFDLSNAVADVEIQNASIRLSTITTPIDGVVTRIDAPYAGVHIPVPSQATIEVVNPASFFYSASADQNEVIGLSEGQTGDLTFDAYPETTVSGTITHISLLPKEGETGTVYTIKIAYPRTDMMKFRIGMTGDITFVTKRKEQALAIPGKFLQSENGKYFVYIQSNGKREKRDVTIGMETDDAVEITSGLEAGTTVYD